MIKGSTFCPKSFQVKSNIIERELQNQVLHFFQISLFLSALGQVLLSHRHTQTNMKHKIQLVLSLNPFILIFVSLFSFSPLHSSSFHFSILLFLNFSSLSPFPPFPAFLQFLYESPATGTQLRFAYGIKSGCSLR